MEAPNRVELCHATHDEIVAELRNRNVNARFLLLRMNTAGDIEMRWKGYGIDALGMCQYALTRLTQRLAAGEDDQTADVEDESDE